MKLRLPRLLKIAIMAAFSTTALFAGDRHEGPLSGGDPINFGGDTLTISTGDAGSSTTFSGNLEGDGTIIIGGGEQMGGTLVFTGKHVTTIERIGNFTISNATLDLRGGGRLFSSQHNRSVLSINAGGTLILEDWGYGIGTKNLGGLGHNDGFFVLNGGTVRMTQDVLWDNGNHSGGSRSILLKEGENTLCVDEGKTWVVAGKIYQEGESRTLNKTGSGRLEFGRAVEYTGLTTIGEGTLSLVVGKKWESNALVDDGLYGELKGDVLLSGAGTTLEGSGTGTGGNIVAGEVTMQGANATLSGKLAISKSVTITGREATLNGSMKIGESVKINGDNASATFSGDFVIGGSVEMRGANATLNGELTIRNQEGVLGNLIVQKTNESETSGASAATPAIINGKVVANELRIRNDRYSTQSGKGISQLNIEEGADVSVGSLYVGFESIGCAAQLNLKGGTLTVTPAITDNDGTPKNTVYIGHWNGIKGSLIVEGGVLNAESAVIAVGQSGNNLSSELSVNTFDIKSGEASVSGVDLGVTGITAYGSGTSILNVSGGTLKIGKTGIIQTVVENDDGSRVVNINLGASVVGARDSWSSILAMKLGYMASEEASGNTMTTLNTAMGDAEEGYTVTLGGVLSDYSENQIGGLIKTGKGVLVLSAANTYKGDTVLEEGSLYLGHDTSLGSNNAAKLTLWDGTTLAADSGAISFSQVVSMGTIREDGADTTEGEVIYLGTATKSGKLTMNGAVTLQHSVNTLEVNADTTFGGAVESLSGKLIKKGNGTLTFAGSGTAINELEIKTGTVDFDSTESLIGVNQINVTEKGKLDLSHSATAANIHFSGAGTLAGASSFTGNLQLGETDGTAVWTVLAEGDTQAGSLLLSNQNVRMDVDGAFSTKSITFALGFSNASPSDNENTLITASNAEITGTDKDSFALNFDPLYIKKYIESGGGAFQLFSTGVSYGYDVIANNHRQEISLDEELLKDTGRLVWTKVALSSSLIDQNEADSINQSQRYEPGNGFIYLGAKDGQTASISSDVEYVLDDAEEIFTYKLTPGKGNLIYKGLLTGAGHKLDIIDLAGITGNSEDHSEGYVALSNNVNDFGLHTNITGATVIIDLSLDKAQNLTGTEGNLDVNVLGTGDVTLVSSTVSQKGSTLCLRSYGGEKREGINTYTYANNFIVSEGSTLLQSGSNDQIVTGTILTRAGDNTIANDSTNNFILRGRIIHEGNGTLTLHNEQTGGNILLDGSIGQKENPATLESEILNISGAGTVHVLKGYSVQARELTDQRNPFSRRGRHTHRWTRGNEGRRYAASQWRFVEKRLIVGI